MAPAVSDSELIQEAERYVEALELDLKIQQRSQLTEEEEAEERESVLGLMQRVSADILCDFVEDWTLADDPDDHILFVDALNICLGNIGMSLDRAMEACPHLVSECRMCFHALSVFTTRLLWCRFLSSERLELLRILENLASAFARPKDGLCALVHDWCDAILLRDAPHVLEGRRPREPGQQLFPVPYIEVQMGQMWHTIFSNLRESLELALNGCNRRDEAIVAAVVLDKIFLHIWPPGKTSSGNSLVDWSAAPCSVRGWPMIARAVQGQKGRHWGQGLQPEELSFSRLTLYHFIRMAEDLLPTVRKLRLFGEADHGASRLSYIGIPYDFTFELIVLTKARYGAIDQSNSVWSSLTRNDVGGPLSTVASLKRFLILRCKFPPTIELRGSSARRISGNLESLTTLSLSASLSMLFAAHKVSSIAVFDVHRSRVNPVAELRFKLTGNDGIIGSKGYDLRVPRFTPVLFTRLMCDLKLHMECPEFQAKYADTRVKRSEIALGVYREVLPKHGIGCTASGLVDLRLEARHILSTFGDAPSHRSLNSLNSLVAVPFAAELTDVHHDDLCTSVINSICIETVRAHHASLTPSAVERLVAAYGIVARANLTENQNSLKTCEVLCMALLRDDEMPIIQQSFITSFGAVARATYIATAWQRRQQLLGIVRRPGGYHRARSAIVSAQLLGLGSDPAVELQILAMHVLQTDLFDFLSENNCEQLALDWEFGSRDINAVEPSFGTTALHIAAGDGRLRLMCALMAVGARMNPRDMWGRTPAYWAAVNDQELALAALVVWPLSEGGCDMDQEDIHGQTPRELAQSNGFNVSVEPLQHWWGTFDAAQALGTVALMDDAIWEAFVDKAMAS